jgi:dipeptidyl aminopeptidase/acylaminoacyl peptidase
LSKHFDVFFDFYRSFYDLRATKFEFRMKIFYLILSLLLTSVAFAQKKTIDHTAYQKWKRFEFTGISIYGNYTFYTVKPLKGDGYVAWIQNTTGLRDSCLKAFAPKFANDESFVAFRKSAGFDTLRKLDLAKVAKDKWVKDTLVIQLFEKDTKKDTLFQFAKLDKFEVSKEGGWIAFTSFPNENKAAVKKKKWWQRKAKVIVEPKANGKILTVFHPTSGKKKIIKGVSSFLLDPIGKSIAYTTNFKRKEKDSLRLHVYQFETEKTATTAEDFEACISLAFDAEGQQLIYLSSRDTNENKQYNLGYFSFAQNSFSVIEKTTIDSNTISSNYSPNFSKDGKRIYFGVAKAPFQTPEDTLVETEKVKLDLWSHTDALVQTQQLVQLDANLKKTNLSVYDLFKKESVELETETLRTFELSNFGDSKFALGVDASKYEYSIHYIYPSKSDYYLINTETGISTPLKLGIYGNAWLSPMGNEFIYLDSTTMQLRSINTSSKIESCITCDTKVNWFEDLNGMPTMPDAIGIVGWFKTERQVLLHSENDIWVYDYNEKRAKNITDDTDTENDIKFRFERWNTDSSYIAFNEGLVLAVNNKTKEESVYDMHYHDDHMDLMKVWHGNEVFVNWRKAKKGNQVYYSTSSVSKYSDLYTCDAKFTNPTRLTNINAQQSNYNWATVEQVKWITPKGLKLDGLMYKPEDFDSTKKYPLLVYFYELYSDRIHDYYAPRPSASIINPIEYASAGYMVFIPDIRYDKEVGHPGNAAYDCIVGGTDAMLKQFPCIDPNRLGLQGQSWGGYQTAQLITMTNKYAAAMAGAPVSNMTSAYGGIRWGSGLNRQFQYERSQSRIGKTLWTGRDLYIENSPVFHLNKVKTPLLIMANDKDGAVPWYQGIELYMGLRRLGQPVWMLNYNGDDHNLLQMANKMDLSIRMRQFFDHYLLSKPATKWMLEGIPATVKGKELRY